MAAVGELVVHDLRLYLVYISNHIRGQGAVGRSLVYYLAMFDENKFIAEKTGQVEIMHDCHYVDVIIFIALSYEAENFQAVVDVQIGCRLVKEEYIRILGQSPG